MTHDNRPMGDNALYLLRRATAEAKERKAATDRHKTLLERAEELQARIGDKPR